MSGKSPRRRKPRAPTPSPATTTITITIEEPLWRGQKPALLLLRRAARRALAAAADGKPAAALTILLADDARLKALNTQFRGKRKPTNVLSFAGDAFQSDGAYLGDIAIAYGTVAREAQEQGKSFAAHSAHLAAHGVLHLLGYDHEKATDAERMEALETGIMAGLGIADPYASAGKAA